LGKDKSLLRFPAINANTNLNLNLQSGAIRFWFAPAWSSASVGGSGPGSYGRLLEVGAPSKDATVGWWSLYFNPEGTEIYFTAHEIAWNYSFAAAQMALGPITDAEQQARRQAALAGRDAAPSALSASDSPNGPLLAEALCDGTSGLTLIPSRVVNPALNGNEI